MQRISSQFRVEVQKHYSYSPFLHKANHDLDLPTNIYTKTNIYPTNTSHSWVKSTGPLGLTAVRYF
jgi:hypothetical protein